MFDASKETLCRRLDKSEVPVRMRPELGGGAPVSEFDLNLFPNGKPTDPKSLDRIADQYRLAVEMWDRVRARRQQSNAFYVSINSAFIAAINVAQPGVLSQRYLSLVGLVICVLWVASIINYGSLADDKHFVITRLEQVLPSCPFSAESLLIKNGNRRTKRRPFTWIERGVPSTFALMHANGLFDWSGRIWRIAEWSIDR